MERRARPIAAVVLPGCLFVSGGASLAYEVSWAKSLAFFIGSTAVAHTVVLATFMGGLAAGAWLFGRWADRTKRPLRLYGTIELGISTLCFLFPWLIEWAGSAYLWAAAPVREQVGLLIPIRAALAVAVIAVPSILMGGTLPVVARFYVQSLPDVGSGVGRLYFVNALGAVVGCLLAGFYLVPKVGLTGTIWIGVAANLMVAAVALFFAYWVDRDADREREIEALAEPAGDETASPSREGAGAEISPFPVWVAWIALLATAASGAASMTYEIVWIRILTLVMGGSAYAFTAMLAAFILGIAIGSALVAWKRTGLARAGLGAFGGLEVAVAFITVVSIPLYSRLPHLYMRITQVVDRHPDNFGLFLALGFLVCLAAMIVPTVLLGATFPLAARLATRSMAALGGGVGRTYAFNTAGTVLGTVLAAHVLMPRLGLQGTLVLAAMVNLVAGVGCLAGAWKMHAGPVTRWEGRRRAALVGMAVAALVVVGVARPELDRMALNRGVFRVLQLRMAGYGELALWARSSVDVLYHRDGANGTVMVMQGPDVRFMNVNGKTDASDGPDLETQYLGGHLPALVHPNPRRALIVGLGSGATAAALLAHENVEVITVELSAEIVEGARFFENVNDGMLDHPRSKLVVEDAQAYLALSEDEYDIIVSIPSNPWVAGNASLFTTEFFDLVKARLAPDGIFVQWFHDYEMTEEAVTTILRTVTSTFPTVSLFAGGAVRDYLLVASHGPVDYDPTRIDARLHASPRTLEHLAHARIRSHVGIFARHILEGDDVRRIVGEGRLQTRRRPVLEYQAPVGVFLSGFPDFFQTYDRRRFGDTRSGVLLDRVLDSREVLTDAEYAEILDAVDGPFADLRVAVARAWAESGSVAGTRRYAEVLLKRNHLHAAAYVLDRLVETGEADPADLTRRWAAETRRIAKEGSPLSPAGRLDEAAARMLEAAEGWGSVEAFELAGATARQVGLAALSSRAFERALAAGPEVPAGKRLQLMVRVAEGRRLSGDLEGAEAMVGRLLDQDPSHYPAHVERFRIRRARASGGAGGR
jgi:spermidine synthase